ncbi:MAG: hypothetical protein ACFFD4_29810 [Candidatus Odinarchaeota archaeon]
MIDEIIVVNSGGLPVFYYDRHSSLQTGDDVSMLRAGFFSAMTQFGQEMADDEIKYVVFEKKSHVLRKALGLLIVFTEFTQGKRPDLSVIENDISLLADFLKAALEQKGMDDLDYVNEDILNEYVNGIITFLAEKQIIAEKITPAETAKARKKVQRFVFKSVGYKPGQCNIGRTERLIRLITGLMGIAITFVAFIGLLYLETLLTVDLRIFRLLLVIPLFFAFQGVYQYFFRFCVNNALRKRYVMR